MTSTQRRVDAIRRMQNPLVNNVLDEYRAGRISRRDFLRRATVTGMSIPLASLVASACASNSQSPTRSGGAAGGTIKAGIPAPGKAIDPWVLGDNSSTCLIGQTGEYLCLSYGEPELKPVLAKSWEPNKKADVWTFKIREGVKFSDGSPMTARDVATTFNRIADPANGTNALETLKGVLSPGGAQALDDYTVRFELEQSNGNWPWLASSDNASAIILPENYQGNWSDTWIGTGPWKIESFTPEVQAVFSRNDAYWGQKPPMDRLVISFYQDEVSMTLGLQAREVQAIAGFSVPNGRAILGSDKGFKVNALQSAQHSPVFMRVDRHPLDDVRVRRALALSINRKDIVDTVLDGYADIGNDSPFAPVFASTKRTVAQRQQDLQEARRLLASANYPSDYTLPINVWDYYSNTSFAQILQASFKQIGVSARLNVMDTQTFLGTGKYGSSPQLDSTCAISAWGARGVPNTYLDAQLTSDGVRNCPHFHDETYDRLYSKYLAETDLQSQRRIAGQIQQYLLDQTPIIYPFFQDHITATLPNVSGVVPTAMGHLLFNEAKVTS